jgi:hypothetical protein
MNIGNESIQALLLLFLFLTFTQLDTDLPRRITFNEYFQTGILIIILSLSAFH